MTNGLSCSLAVLLTALHVLKYRCSFWHRPICRNLHRTSKSSWQPEIETKQYLLW